VELLTRSSPSRERGAGSPAEPPPALPHDPTLAGLFHRAAEMAFFILGNRAAAAAAATAALSKLPVAARAQKRRRVYLPKGRTNGSSAARPVRTRVTTSDAQLVQRLVFLACEAYERDQEDAGAADAAQMLVRYVKHLVRITLKRNSFYVVLGMSRLLHGYSTAETMELYAVIVQDPERVPDDPYCRARKKQLLQELVERFGPLLRLEAGPRGEKRFATAASAEPSVSLLRESLRRFTPWDTACVVPERFDRWSTELAPFAFKGADPDAEHPVQLNRIHAAIDPTCYERLTRLLGLPSPDQRLKIPEFHVPDDRPPAGPGPEPWRPDAREWIAAEERLRQDAVRRRAGDARLLSIVVDGRDRTRLDRTERSSVAFDLDGGAEVVEIRDGAGQCLALWLTSGEEPSSALMTVTESGLELSFVARPRAGGGLHLEIRCRETNVLRVLRDAWRSRWPRWRRAWTTPSGRAAWGALATACVLLVAVWPTVRPAAPVGGTPPAHGIASPTAAAATASPVSPSPMSPLDTRELTRGGAPAARPLADVRRLFVDPIEADGGAVLRHALSARVARSSRFAVAARRAEADAVVKCTVAASGDLRIELVNRAGQILWHGTKPWNRAAPGPAANAAVTAWEQSARPSR
jgi:hypothetical protein